MPSLTRVSVAKNSSISLSSCEAQASKKSFEPSIVKSTHLEERTVDRTELYTCDEAFLCGSAMEITPVLSFDKYVVGNGYKGELTLAIHKEYLDSACGNNERLKSWVTPIY